MYIFRINAENERRNWHISLNTAHSVGMFGAIYGIRKKMNMCMIMRAVRKYHNVIISMCRDVGARGVCTLICVICIYV